MSIDLDRVFAASRWLAVMALAFALGFVCCTLLSGNEAEHARVAERQRDSAIAVRDVCTAALGMAVLEAEMAADIVFEGLGGER
jgi:hypothetical protein